MNPSIRRFTLDTNATRSQISIPVTLNDTGRIWHITLTEGGICYAIEQGCLAVLTVKRPNGTYFEEFCPIAKNVTVIYDFRQNENTAAVEGIHDCEVTVYGINHERLTSATFTMVVGQRAVNSDDITITDDDRTVMDYMIGEEAKRQAAETERAEAFNTRMASFDEAYSNATEMVKKIKDISSELEETYDEEKYIASSVWIRYSKYPDGRDFVERWTHGYDYIGIAVAKNAPTSRSGYTWRIFISSENVRALVDDCADEVVSESVLEYLPPKIEEKIGAYNIYTRFAEDNKGTNMTASMGHDHSYIGVAFATKAPTNPSDYSWSLFFSQNELTTIIHDKVDNWIEAELSTEVSRYINAELKGHIVTELNFSAAQEPWNWGTEGYAYVNPRPRKPTTDECGTYCTDEGDDVGEDYFGMYCTGSYIEVYPDYIHFHRDYEYKYQTGEDPETDYVIDNSTEGYTYEIATGAWYSFSFDAWFDGGNKLSSYSSPSAAPTVWYCGSTQDPKLQRDYITELVYSSLIVGSGAIQDNHEYRISGEGNIYLAFTGDSKKITDVFNACIVIKTEGAYPVISWTKGNLYFVGDDCEDGVLYAQRNRIYDIVVWWNGFIYRASVTAAFQEV